MSKKNILLLFGGQSAEHEISLISATSIYQALNQKKYEITLIGIDTTGHWIPLDPEFLLSTPQPKHIPLLKTSKNLPSSSPFDSILHATHTSFSRNIDVVLPVLHGPHGEDGTVQGFLELANIAYVGSGVLGSALGMDKEVSKKLFEIEGIPVVKYQLIRKKDFIAHPKTILQAIQNRFRYPYFIKPVNMGSSVGVSKIHQASEVHDKIMHAFSYDQKVLIEEGIDARELECAVLGNDTPNASVVGEIIPHHSFYSYDAKYQDPQGAQLQIPAELSLKQVQTIQDYALKAFKILECSGMARVDFFLDRKTHQIFLNEINTIPGFTSISMYPKLWEATGVAYSALLDQLIHLALERHQGKQDLKISP